MRIVTNLRELFGSLSDEQLMKEIMSHWSSPHQLQPCCQHHVLFVRQDVVLHLDHASMTCLVEYMERFHPHNDFTQQARSMLNKIEPVKPKPEPEVAAILRRPVRESEAVSAFEPEPDPRWKVRIRTKMESGGTIESVQYVESLRDIEDLVLDGPSVSRTKHIKIKLEYLQ